jgi:hypothetical protein
MLGAPSDTWPLMPQTPVRAISGVRLEHDHGAHPSGPFVPHHPLIAGRTIVSSERGLAGVRAQTLDMITQRDYSRRSVAHIAAVRPKFPPSRLVDAFDQVVEPLITEITCLRSPELRLFHLVSVQIDSPPGGTTG